MAIIERTFINHHIEVHETNGRISVRLIDESFGPGEVVDESRVIEPLGSSFLIPVHSGGSTPGSAEEVVYILSKLKMAVRLSDEDGENPIVVDHSYLPAADDQRLEFIIADWSSMRQVERDLEDGARKEPPEWYVTLKSMRANPVRSLF
ncbi:hypothetical protein ACVIGB_000712 [Bradyrhizobium sp. USDA 4341]